MLGEISYEDDGKLKVGDVIVSTCVLMSNIGVNEVCVPLYNVP